MLKNGSDSINQIKRNDIILIMIFIVVAITAVLFVSLQKRSGTDVLITINGKEYGEWPLSENKVITIKEKAGTNTVNINNKTVSMIQADCRDKICVHHKKISKDGETIVCLPHKLVVEIVDATQKKKYDGMTK